MYTVVRITSEAASEELTAKFLAQLNARTSDLALPRKGGLACSLSRADSWKEHASSIATFIDEHSDTLKEAVSADYVVVVDVAIDPEDTAGKLMFSLVSGPLFLKRFADVGAAFEVTIY